MILVCNKCNEEIVSPVVGANDLGPVLLELANHCNLKHNMQYREYGTNLGLMMQLLPAYYMIECFIDVDKTAEKDSVAGMLINQSQRVITDALGLDVGEVVKEPASTQVVDLPSTPS